MERTARPAVTALGISVLALLEERPMHPYEMYQLLLARGEELLVKVRPGSLYHTIARLAEQELVHADGVERAGNRPERTTYRITDVGRKALRARISEILRAPSSEYPIFPVALAEAHNLPSHCVVTLLRERLEHLGADLADLTMMREWATTHGVARRYWLVLEYLQATLGAEVEWITHRIDELESGALEWEEFDPVTGARRSQPEHPWPGSDPAHDALPPAPRRSARAARRPHLS
ncbi:PadR family transcriptional regulator [Nocardia goodfellowii]|uniref:DNA-binding PadR family transcriptional regulator n=1 Tax=Nocardia goodfellowii TaxID=882446 RepID=A0ABS4QC98_9NOCA|nr:helix-turn-helix transcriptional regulator [Nocardia goodfellowii]MBP2189317.1 DNA-binding PadR family transcriptional regulator [Nocardia goodfellowii]